MVDERTIRDPEFYPLSIRTHSAPYLWEALDCNGSLLPLAERLAHLPGTVFLPSSSGRGENSFLAIDPWLKVTVDSDGLHISGARQERLSKDGDFLGDPFSLLKSLMRSIQYESTSDEPITAGLLGYFSFELKDQIEELPSTVIESAPLPKMYLVAPRYLFSHHLPSGRLTLHTTILDGEDSEDVRARFEKVLENNPPSPLVSQNSELSVGDFHSNFSKAEFIAAVERAKAYIQQGEIYQVNLAQTFQAEFTGSPFHLFLRLLKENPAEYFAYINGGDFQVISSSPERFLTRRGGKVKTSPIKGTRPRGRTIEEDASLKEDLKASEKEQAELSMIVDLMRNDLSRVSGAGSVKVEAHRVVEEYSNVFHLVSHITSELSSRQDSIDLLRACFPPGSISGCPKIRALKVIDELEPHARGVYTGAIGYISFHDTLDLSVAIRTAVHHEHTLSLSLGSGIVADSDPVKEYEETLHKGASFWKVLGQQTSALPAPRPESMSYGEVWIDGRFYSEPEAKVPALSRAFLYGAGVFETIRVTDGECEFLELHVNRLKRSYFELFGEHLPVVNFHSIARELLKRNGMASGVLKLVAGLQEPGTPPLLMAHVRPYTGPYGAPELLGVGDNLPVMKLLPYPERRASPLASHKTLNYLYYFQAGEWAKRNGADYALICNSDGSVSETNATNVLGIQGATVLRPASANVLPGIMEGIVLEILQKQGYTILQKQLDLSALSECNRVLITNSLLGCLPAKILRARA